MGRNTKLSWLADRFDGLADWLGSVQPLVSLCRGIAGRLRGTAGAA